MHRSRIQTRVTVSGVCFKMSGEGKPVESYWKQLREARRKDKESLEDYLKRLKGITITCSPAELGMVVQEKPAALVFPHRNYPRACDGRSCGYNSECVFGAFLCERGLSSQEADIVYQCFKHHRILTFRDLGKVKAGKLVEEILLLDDALECIYDGQLSRETRDFLANGLKNADLIQTEAATAAAATSGLKLEANEALHPNPEQVYKAIEQVRAFLGRLQHKAIYKENKRKIKVFFQPVTLGESRKVISMLGVKYIFELVKNPEDPKFIKCMNEVAQTLGLEYKGIKTNLEQFPPYARWDEDKEDYERMKKLNIYFQVPGN
jgi:hypothetical protein